ncbi:MULTISPECIES: DUF1963 domain-containing protein [Streptomyces]|uniref:DUF1963 domain-containing protein n=1 Tax=Streptomyces TaxID=1883 RepID=UPI00345C5D49
MAPARLGFRLIPPTDDRLGRRPIPARWPLRPEAWCVLPAVHLLQLAEDEDFGWGWGDAGTMYFTIPAKIHRAARPSCAFAERLLKGFSRFAPPARR